MADVLEGHLDILWLLGNGTRGNLKPQQTRPHNVVLLQPCDGDEISISIFILSFGCERVTFALVAVQKKGIPRRTNLGSFR